MAATKALIAKARLHSAGLAGAARPPRCSRAPRCRPEGTEGTTRLRAEAQGEAGCRSELREDPHRQSRRDRLPRACAPRARWATARSRCSAMPTPTRRTWRWPTRRCASAPPPAAESYLNVAAMLDAARAHRRRCGAPGLRLPQRERRLRAGLRRRRPGVHRPAAVGHRGDGRQGAGQAAHASRPACPARRATSGSDAGRRDAARRGATARLPAAGQGGGRRRRARHAPGAQRRRDRRGARRRAPRGAERLRRRHADAGAADRARPPHRDPGVRRRARQRRSTSASATARRSAGARR